MCNLAWYAETHPKAKEPITTFKSMVSCRTYHQVAIHFCCETEQISHWTGKLKATSARSHNLWSVTIIIWVFYTFSLQPYDSKFNSSKATIPTVLLCIENHAKKSMSKNTLIRYKAEVELLPKYSNPPSFLSHRKKKKKSVVKGFIW